MLRSNVLLPPSLVADTAEDNRDGKGLTGTSETTTVIVCPTEESGGIVGQHGQRIQQSHTVVRRIQNNGHGGNGLRIG